VIGLTINQRRLKTIREVRARALGRHVQDSYASEREIVREIRYANEMIARQKWRSVDVSYKAIEEVAKQVAEMRGLPLRTPE
jgi:regulator of PEP synthase PpsR (kinase-PPPase family)